MARFFLPPSTAHLRNPHKFSEGDEVTVGGTEEVGTVKELRRGPVPTLLVEYENGATVEVPADRLLHYTPDDVPDTWPTDPEHTASWNEPQWLKTFAHQSAWTDGELFQTRHEVGERVTGQLGTVVIEAIGHSPLGVVYRVRPVMGGESYDLMEDQIQSDRVPALAKQNP